MEGNTVFSVASPGAQISRETYGLLRSEFGRTSSWAVWAAPENGNWKSKSSISDMSPFADEEQLLPALNGRYIFVGLNPAVHDNTAHSGTAWKNFHSCDIRRSQDYKLRYALRGTQYWGAFITDVYTGIADTDSGSAMKRVNAAATNESVSNLLRIRDMLGGSAAIVAMGKRTFAVLKKHLPPDMELKMITHYSAYMNPETYRETVLRQLDESTF